jgi:hypothetical protein
MEHTCDKKRKIVEVLRSNKFENLKGSQTLLDKIKKQRSSLIEHSNDSSTDFTTAASEKKQQQESQSSDEGTLLRQLLMKQQSVLNQLNDENVQLIQENGRYRCELSSTRIERDLAHTLNSELKRENRTLKRRCQSTRSECEQQRRELDAHNREMIAMSIKIHRLKRDLVKLENKRL